jgi:hypothetical protein
MLANTASATEALVPTASAFDSVFNQADPRAYFRAFGSLGYILPDLAQPIFRDLVAAVGKFIGRPPRVLELGCGFGHASALVRFPIDSERLARRYTSPDLATLDSRALAEFDHSYYRSWPLLTDSLFIGFDPSAQAIEFALNAGIFSAAIAGNLDCEEPTIHGMRILRDVDLIISAGAIGRVNQPTFSRILDLQKDSRMPWIANFVPRVTSYESFDSLFDAFGLVTEKLEGVTFVERRFHSGTEMERAVDAVLRRGIDPAGRETDGFRHAEFYLTRPRDSIATVLLPELITVTNGPSRAGCENLIVGRPRGTPLN